MSSRQKFKQQTLLEFPPSPPRLSKRKRIQTRETSTSSSDAADSDVGAIRFESEPVDMSDGDHSPRRPKRCTTTRLTGDESLEETVQDDSRPRKRKFIKGTRPPTPEEDDDVLEPGNLLEHRLRARGKMTVFQKNLEKLKSKKRGEIVLVSSSDAEQSESSAGHPFKGAKLHHSQGSDASDNETDHSSEDDDEGFIVHDDEHGAPVAQLPPAFSLSTHQDLAHQFKIVCQLFVHLAVRPLVDRRPFLERALKEEEYLSVPLQVTRRKLSGMRDSLVASSVWKSDFKKTLETFPKLTLVRLKFTVPQCDACHLGARLSTLMGRLSGKPYDQYDFEDVSDDDSEDDDDHDHDSVVDRERGVGKEFYLGRFCAARTRVYHQFSHWEYSLYKSLQQEIIEAQDRTRQFVKVAYSGGIKPPRDLHDADRVMEWLDERGIIEMEWQKVREMMDSARRLERGEVD